MLTEELEDAIDPRSLRSSATKEFARQTQEKIRTRVRNHKLPENVKLMEQWTKTVEEKEKREAIEKKAAYIKARIAALGGNRYSPEVYEYFQKMQKEDRIK